MSISITPKVQEEIKRYADRRGLSASLYIENLLQQALKLNIDDDPVVIGKPIDEEVVPVVLKIPAGIKSDSEKLGKWLNLQMNRILMAMAKKNGS